MKIAGHDERLLSRARLLHGSTNVPAGIVAASLGLSPETFRRKVAQWGWPARIASRAEPPVPTIATAVSTATNEGIDRLATGRAIERFVASRIAFHEAEARGGRDADPERTARTVSHYARALGLVRAYLSDLEKDEAADENRPPARTLCELRDELRGHLQRIRREEAARRRPRGPRPDAD